MPNMERRPCCSSLEKAFCVGASSMPDAGLNDPMPEQSLQVGAGREVRRSEVCPHRCALAAGQF